MPALPAAGTIELPNTLKEADSEPTRIAFAPPETLTTALENAITASTAGNDPGDSDVTAAEQRAIDNADAALLNWRGSGTIKVNLRLLVALAGIP